MDTDKIIKRLAVVLSCAIRIVFLLAGITLGLFGLLGFVNIQLEDSMSPTSAGNAVELLLAYFMIRAALHKEIIWHNEFFIYATRLVGVIFLVAAWWIGSWIITALALKPFFGKEPPVILLIFAWVIVASFLWIISEWMLRQLGRVLKQRTDSKQQ